MFEYLKKHKIILVTGPQRSGTTICARMIAHDTGHTYIDEQRFQIWDVKKARQIAKDMAPSVVQGPGLLLDADRFVNVVLMKRRLKDIEKSLRLRARLAETLAKKYYPALLTNDPAKFLPAIMYANYFVTARPKVHNQIDIDYFDLQRHPLWVPEEERKGWRIRQWKN